MNPYQVLGVQPGASPDAIKAAYRRRMMQVHPDKGGTDTEAKMVNRAYEMLTKPQPQPAPVDQPQGVYWRVVYYGNWTTSANTTTSTGWW